MKIWGEQEMTKIWKPRTQWALIGLILVVIASYGWYKWNVLMANASGTYTGRTLDNNTAILIQMVQESNGQITGFAEDATLRPDGTLGQDNIPLSGAHNGEELTVTLTPVDSERYANGSFSLSGSYDGTSINLTGNSNGTPINLVLRKGEASVYQSYVASLEARSEVMLQAKSAEVWHEQQVAAQQAAAQQAAMQEAAAQQAAAQQAEDEAANAANARTQAANDLEHEIAVELSAINKVSSVPIRLAQLSQDSRDIKEHTLMMQIALNKEEKSGGSQSAASSEISAALIQENLNEANAVNDVQNHYTMVEQSGIPILLKMVKNTDQKCSDLRNGVLEEQFNHSYDESDACQSIENMTPQLTSEVNQLESAYQSLFSIWASENRAQQAIIHQSTQ